MAFIEKELWYFGNGLHFQISPNMIRKIINNRFVEKLLKMFFWPYIIWSGFTVHDSNFGWTRARWKCRERETSTPNSDVKMFLVLVRKTLMHVILKVHGTNVCAQRKYSEPCNTRPFRQLFKLSSSQCALTTQRLKTNVEQCTTVPFDLIWFLTVRQISIILNKQCGGLRGFLLAEMEFNIHNYVFISVYSRETTNFFC